MNYGHAAARFQQYQDIGSAAVAFDANPHRLIAMLYDGLIERLGRAESAAERQDTHQRVAQLGSAMAIIEHLKLILDMDAGGEIAQRLDALYDYCLRRLMQANAGQDADGIREVSRLLMTVKSGWDQIAP